MNAEELINRFVPPIALLAIGVTMVYPAVQGGIASDVARSEIADATFGVLLWVAYFGTRIASALETDAVTDGLRPADWVALASFGLWIVAGVAFVFAGVRSPTVIAFTVLGAAAVALWGYSVRGDSDPRSEPLGD